MASLQHGDPSRQRVWRTVFIPLIVFGLAVLGTRFWIQFRTRPPENPVYLTARHEIPGYRFVPVALGSQVEDTLATTNLFNGHFFDQRSQRVSVFAAHWQAGQGDGGTLFGHTPEICWLGHGFRTVRHGEPSQVFIPMAGRRIPFQCRVLKHPEQPTPEITLWAACIDGRWDDIPYGPPPNQTEGEATIRTYLQGVGRTLATRLASVRRIVQNPFASNARKQFVRFSIPLTTDWQPALAELEAFAHQWLEPQ